MPGLPPAAVHKEFSFPSAAPAILITQEAGFQDYKQEFLRLWNE